jgi:hypothetical protein
VPVKLWSVFPHSGKAKPIEGIEKIKKDRIKSLLRDIIIYPWGNELVIINILRDNNSYCNYSLVKS